MNELRDFLVDGLRLAISAHNSQPFHLRFPDAQAGDATAVELWAETARLLPAADPKMKDLLMSAGAVFETLRLLLSTRATRLEVLSIETLPTAPATASGGAFLVAKFRTVTDPSVREDRLARELARRFSYRGSFARAPEPVDDAVNARPAADVAAALGAVQLAFTSDTKVKKSIAKLYDQVNMRFLALPGYVVELKSWMRLSKGHAAWAVDGLNAEAMALSGFEALGAGVVLRPAVFKVLNALGLAKILLAEEPKTKGAHFLVGIHGKDEGHFEAGRAFLKGWLALTASDLFGAPLSLLTDDPLAVAEVRALFSLPPETRVYNVMRVGRLHDTYRRYEPARRPASGSAAAPRAGRP